MSSDSGEQALGAAPPNRSPSASACEPFREYVEGRLELGRNAMAIWQDLEDELDFVGGYASVRRSVKNLKGERPVRSLLRYRHGAW